MIPTQTGTLLRTTRMNASRHIYECAVSRIWLLPWQTLYVCIYQEKHFKNVLHRYPPKNGEIALWLNMRVVKCKYCVSQKQNGFNDKIHWYSILLTYLNSRQGFNGLNYFYAIISVKIDSLPANPKNRESTRLWTARKRFLNPWADLSEKTYQECEKQKNVIFGSTCIRKDSLRMRKRWLVRTDVHGKSMPHIILVDTDNTDAAYAE